MPLTDAQIRRYARQLVMKEVTGAGQESLLNARVLVYGSGLSAELCVLYLAAAGVGGVHISPREKETDGLVWRTAALNPDCAVTSGTHGIRPDAAADFLQDAGPHEMRQIAGALKAGIPYFKVLRPRNAAIVKRWYRGDPCPGCLLNRAGFNQSDLIGAPDHGVAGPAAAAAIITTLLGIAGNLRTAVYMDVAAGEYRDLVAEAFPECVLCGLLGEGDCA